MVSEWLSQDVTRADVAGPQTPVDPATKLARLTDLSATLLHKAFRTAPMLAYANIHYS
jgi:hypothetical protein